MWFDISLHGPAVQVVARHAAGAAKCGNDLADIMVQDSTTPFVGTAAPCSATNCEVSRRCAHARFHSTVGPLKCLSPAFCFSTNRVKFEGSPAYGGESTGVARPNIFGTE